MPVVICLLRGVNVGGHHKIKMEVLRDLCVSLKCESPQTLLQSGNVVFRTRMQNLAQLSASVSGAIERKLGFRPDVILRTAGELREIVTRSPFAKRPGIEPAKLVVSFLGGEVNAKAQKELQAMDIAPEELHALSRELYIYFPNGQGRMKLSWPRVDKILGFSGTARNWNTVTKLLEVAEAVEAH